MPDSPGLRPTPDRVRETLFNWIKHNIAGANCVDLFAGSGALGFEALSRGAAAVAFVESDYTVVNALKQQARSLNSSVHTIYHADSCDWLKRSCMTFDLVFLDPPFGQGLIAKCCKMIQHRSLLKDGGMVYIESEHELEPPDGWSVKKQATAGRVKSALVELQQDTK